MKKAISIWIALVIIASGWIASAMEVNLPIDYYDRGVDAYATATDGNVTVTAGQYGLIQTTASDGTVQDIKNVCYESIYYMTWKDGMFVGFSKNYKLTSPDGYNWTTEANTDWNERQQYGVQSENTKSIGVMWMTNTVELNEYADYEIDSESPPQVNIYYTGKEYIKTEDYYTRGQVAYDRRIYTSTDRENWEYKKTVSLKDIQLGLAEDIFPSSSTYSKQIINTGKEYLVKMTTYDYVINTHEQEQPIRVFDLEYNYVKTINMDDYIVDMSYVDGVYYITSNKSITYKSTDLENWEVFGEEIGVPLNNGTKTLYKTHIPLNTGVPWAEGFPCYYEGPILEENGEPAKNVVLEDIELYGMRVIGDYFVAFSSPGRTADQYTDDSNIKGLDGEPLDIKRYYTEQPVRVYFSKDGVYWASQNVSPGPMATITQSEENMIIEMISNSRTINIKFSDMEAMVPKSDLRVQLNNRVLGFSTPPVEENDRILVPMRFLFEQMGAEVEWDEATQTATATVPISTETQIRTFSTESEKSVSFAIDNTTATVNGAETEMDVPARLVNDKTMVPLRFLSENLGYEVAWDEATQTAIVTTE